MTTMDQRFPGEEVHRDERASGDTIVVNRSSGRFFWGVILKGEQSPRTVKPAPSLDTAIERANVIVLAAVRARSVAKKHEAEHGDLLCSGAGCAKALPRSEAEECPHCGVPVCSSCGVCSAPEAQDLLDHKKHGLRPRTAEGALYAATKTTRERVTEAKAQDDDAQDDVRAMLRRHPATCDCVICVPAEADPSRRTL